VRSGSAVGLALVLAVVAAGCAQERPSALSIRNCLRDRGAEDVRFGTFAEAPPGIADDWHGVHYVSWAVSPQRVLDGLLRGTPVDVGLAVVARSDADAVRLRRELAHLQVPFERSGSVLFRAAPGSRLARACR
jgi:hypothetical protein